MNSHPIVLEGVKMNFWYRLLAVSGLMLIAVLGGGLFEPSIVYASSSNNEGLIIVLITIFLACLMAYALEVYFFVLYTKAQTKRRRRAFILCSLIFIPFFLLPLPSFMDEMGYFVFIVIMAIPLWFESMFAAIAFHKPNIKKYMIINIIAVIYFIFSIATKDSAIIYIFTLPFSLFDSDLIRRLRISGDAPFFSVNSIIWAYAIYWGVCHHRKKIH